MTELEVIPRLLSWTARRPKDAPDKRHRVSELLRRFCPEPSFREVIKVAGTNGKGSVCAMIEAGLRANGKTVGVFTSPHVQRVTERIRVNGVEISPTTLEHHARSLEPRLLAFVEERGPGCVPSFFEVMMLIAVRFFAGENVEYAIFEAGIGGRQDATGLLRGRVAAITSVSVDHEDRLGSSVREIAREKTGIATERSTLVLGPGIEDSLRMTIRETATAKGVRTICAGRPARGLARAASRCTAPASAAYPEEVSKGSPDCIREMKRPSRGGTASAVSPGHGNTRIGEPLLPDYQLDNLGTAVAVLRCLPGTGNVSLSEPLSELGDGVWPGRFEYVNGSPSWLLDGAHNEEAMRALTAGVDAFFSSTDRTLIYGASREKSFDKYVARLPGLAKHAYVTDDFYNAQNRHVIAARLPKEMKIHQWEHSVEELVAALGKECITPNRMIIATGSLFLVGRVRSALA